MRAAAYFLAGLPGEHELLAAAAELAERRGWELRARPYADSPERVHRPARGQLLAAVERGRVEVVIARRLADLASTLSGLARVATRIEAAGAHLVALEEPIDTTVPAGRGVWVGLRTAASLERERVEAGRRPPGRPRSDIDLERAKALVREGATVSEAARRLGVAASTLYARFKE